MTTQQKRTLRRLENALLDVLSVRDEFTPLDDPHLLHARAVDAVRLTVDHYRRRIQKEG